MRPWRILPWIAIVAACGGATSNDDAGADASNDVVHEDVLQPLDASTDAISTADAPNVCDPSLPDAYVPTWIPPHAPSNACTTTQIQNLYGACVNQPESNACQTFNADAGNAACIACMESPLDATTYGPFLVWHGGDSLEADIGGCMALVDGDLSSTGCGATYAAWQDCYVAACDTCPGGTFDSCAVPAQTGVCGTYQAAAANCYAQSQYATCKQTTFESYFTTYGALFCATGSTDAGTD